jgi:hypothetical protein
MEATIQHIHIYEDGVVEMVVMCNACNHVNTHNITHSSTKKGGKITVDFSKLGNRCCDNHGKNPKSMCTADYKLYM